MIAVAGALQPGRHADRARRPSSAADLNVDSVAAMDLIMEIEDRFEIDIPINLVSDMTTRGATSWPWSNGSSGARGG